MHTLGLSDFKNWRIWIVGNLSQLLKKRVPNRNTDKLYLRTIIWQSNNRQSIFSRTKNKNCWQSKKSNTFMLTSCSEHLYVLTNYLMNMQWTIFMFASCSDKLSYFAMNYLKKLYSCSELSNKLSSRPNKSTTCSKHLQVTSYELTTNYLHVKLMFSSKSKIFINEMKMLIPTMNTANPNSE